MKNFFTVISLIAMLMLFASTAMAHDGEHEGEKKGHGMYEEGSGGSAMEMGRNSRTKAHEYKEEHGGDHSKEHYENPTKFEWCGEIGFDILHPPAPHGCHWGDHRLTKKTTRSKKN